VREPTLRPSSIVIRMTGLLPQSACAGSLAHAGEGQRQMVLARINIAFAQDTREAAIRRVRSFGNIIA
jgi:hypothetical protein